MRVPIILGVVRNSILQSLSCCLLATALLLVFNLKTAQAQTCGNNGCTPAAVDPGPRPGPQPSTGAGHPIPGLPADQVTFWVDGLTLFGDTVSVKGTLSGEPLLGLGPAFNGNSCLLCHSQPAIGGSSPAQNPQIGIANLDGATNTIPPFLAQSGPVLEARFVKNADGTPDGGVHDLFTITGRTDAPANCTLQQPDFATQLQNGNISLRIPIPTFGEGFVENVSEDGLKNNLAALKTIKKAAGIAGRFNTSGNDGTITRFGWKAQNKSMLMFAGEASNVELGITNELFTNERTNSGCATNATPEDNTHVIIPTGTNAGDDASQISSLIENFTIFMRLNAAAIPCDAFTSQTTCQPLGASALRGQALFGTVVAAAGTTANTGVGCVLCHTDLLRTTKSNLTPLNNVEFHPFSDFALHHMGAGLADGISQGQAGIDEFRTAPLWGVGQRIFFLHDGRANNLVTAISLHASPCAAGQVCSEANSVVAAFNNLTQAQQQDLIAFL
ncbi:MAG TPA: di-heme oxidoredictase family protein, partial [Candidatus Angelobacter sp.]|nr:di-heme oxidoredictase family protein [Candidatus Angelobacter sp.]